LPSENDPSKEKARDPKTDPKKQAVNRKAIKREKRGEAVGERTTDGVGQRKRASKQRCVAKGNCTERRENLIWAELSRKEKSVRGREKEH